MHEAARAAASLHFLRRPHQADSDEVGVMQATRFTTLCRHEPGDGILIALNAREGSSATMLARLRSTCRGPFLSPEDRMVLLVQLGVVISASVLFWLGYAVQREMRALMVRERLEVLIRGWDGLAWVVWPLAAPAMLLLIRRFPLVRGHIAWSISRLTLGSIALFLVVTHTRFFLRVLPQVWIDQDAARFLDWDHYASSTLLLLPIDFLTYTGFVSATFAIDYYFKYRRRRDETVQLRVRAAQLESDLAHAELDALRGQLRPHFLFNSFNAVTTLVRQGRNDAAIEMIAELSMLLRMAMERPGHQELTLEAELDFIRLYLAIEHIRFGDKLQLEFAIEPAANRALVPNFLLQPLVENAIKHGISRRVTPGRVLVTANRAGERLQLSVENDGPETPAVAAPRVGGLGLNITHARLEKTYGTDYRFEQQPRPNGGMRIRLDLPWRAAASVSRE